MSDKARVAAKCRGSASIASFNLCNLGLDAPEQRFRGLAEIIVRELDLPDIIAVQEVGSSASAGSAAPVSAAGTYQALAGALMSLGAPEYDWTEIAPLPNADGGEIGRNIRVGYLFNSGRASLERIGTGGPGDSSIPMSVAGRVELSLSPGRITPSAPSFTGDARRHWLPSRKALAAMFRVRDTHLIVVNCHFKSMRGADRRAEAQGKKQRHAQAEAVAEFARRILRLGPDTKLVVLGDLNDTPDSKTLAILEHAGLRNAMLAIPRRMRYSRHHGRRPQLLDHILLSPALVPGHEARIVHCNTNALPESRLSYHDPVVVTICSG